MGERELNLLRAVAEIGKIPESRVTALSSFFETSPVGPVVQNGFYNAVLELTTGLGPASLLKHLLRIEDSVFKRVRTIQQGPRSMDLDLLLYGDEIIDEMDLIVPHPRLTQRRFVLQPLCEIAPELVHPVTGTTIRTLLDTLKSNETVVKI